MNAALGPFAIAAGLLVLGGALKAVRPHDTAIAVEKMAFRVPESVVRLGGIAEAGLGVIALATASGVVAVLVAGSYAVFFAFVALALARRLPIASCGCFGRADSRPSFVHLGVNLGAALAAGAVALDPGIAPPGVVQRELVEGAAYAALVIVGVIAAALAVTLLPRVLALARGDVTR